MSDTHVDPLPHEAVQDLAAPSPKGMLEAAEDPSVLLKLTRMDRYHWQHRMRIKMAQGVLTPSQEMEYGKLLFAAEKGAADIQQMPGERRPLITINILGEEPLTLSTPAPKKTYDAIDVTPED